MTKNKNINFSLNAIKTEKFSIANENYSENKTSEMTTAIRFGIDAKGHVIGAFVTNTFMQAKKPFIEIQVSCHFKIDKSSWDNFVNQKKNEVTIPKGFLTHMAMITVGTSRGILFAKTEGMSLNRFIIPTVNITEMIEKDSVFSLDKVNG